MIITDHYSKLTRSSYRYCLPHCSFFEKNAFQLCVCTCWCCLLFLRNQAIYSNAFIEPCTWVICVFFFESLGFTSQQPFWIHHAIAASSCSVLAFVPFPITIASTLVEVLGCIYCGFALGTPAKTKFANI